MEPLSRGRDRTDLLDHGRAAVDRVPGRALRGRRARRISLRRGGDDPGRGFRQVAQEAPYACQTFRMMLRASLSESWCEGTFTLTTSVAMKRTSGWRAVSTGLKITGA